MKKTMALSVLMMFTAMGAQASDCNPNEVAAQKIHLAAQEKELAELQAVSKYVDARKQDPDLSETESDALLSMGLDVNLKSLKLTIAASRTQLTIRQCTGN